MTVLSHSPWRDMLQDLDGDHLGAGGVAAPAIGRWQALTTWCIEYCGSSSRAAITNLAQVSCCL